MTRETATHRLLTLEASCQTERVEDHDEVVVDAWIVNTGKEPICIRRMKSPIGFLSFILADSDGREIPGRVLYVDLARSSDKQDFLLLDPGNIYGSRLRLIPIVEGGRTYHSLVDYGNKQMARFSLRTPGRYSLSVIYGNGDDGHMAGVQAWHGGGPHELHSSKCWFEIER